MSVTVDQPLFDLKATFALNNAAIKIMKGGCYQDQEAAESLRDAIPAAENMQLESSPSSAWFRN
jgi:hypothetical protein